MGGRVGRRTIGASLRQVLYAWLEVFLLEQAAKVIHPDSGRLGSGSQAAYMFVGVYVYVDELRHCRSTCTEVP